MAERLDACGARYAFFDQLRIDDAAIEWELAGGVAAGELRVNGAVWPLEEFTGVYTRLMDDRELPTLRAEPAGSPRRLAARALHEALGDWCEVTDARVVNRDRAMASNGSKPFQAQLIERHGFRTPPTLVTNDPDAVCQFAAEHGEVVFKSISGQRSIVQRLGPSDVERLELIRWCPVQFQAYVEGVNVRVHTVGERVFATAVETDAVDYRYASHQGAPPARLTATELDDETARRCVELAADLGLPFAGVDLKLAPDGTTYCFEVNPSPAYSYYESNSGQPIAAALADYLRGGGVSGRPFA